MKTFKVLTIPDNSTVIGVRSLLGSSVVKFVSSVHLLMLYNHSEYNLCIFPDLVPSVGSVAVAAIDAWAICCVARPELLHVHLEVGDPHAGLPDWLDVLVEPLLAAVPAVPGLLEAPEPGGGVKHVVAIDPDCARLDVLGSLQGQRQLLAVDGGSEAVHRVVGDSDGLFGGPDNVGA